MTYHLPHQNTNHKYATHCWAIFRIARPMALRTLAGRREYVVTWRSYDRTISARLKDARMRCTAEMHVWVHKRGKNVKEPGRCTY